MADTQYDLIDAEYVDVKDQRVYPNQWTPNARTVAYYPLDAANQYNDCSGHNYHLTKNTYASQGNYGPNVECCYFNSRGTSTGACGLYRTTDVIFDTTNGDKKYTILFWIWYDGGTMRNNPRIVGRYTMELIVCNGANFGVGDTYNGPSINSSEGWVLIGANVDFNTKKISWYKNGEYVSTQDYSSRADFAAQRNGIVIGTRDDATGTGYGEKWSGYMGDVIVEQGLRDKDSHKRFYNQTRRKYHIFEEGDTIAYYPLTQDAKDRNVRNKFAPFDFTSSNVIFNQNGANLDGSTNLITRPYSFMHGDFQYSVCLSFKTNTITNARGEFFSFMLDVSGARAPLLSLRNATITLDYNNVAGGNFNFTAEADTWYRLVFLHKTARENELIINKISCGTVNMGSDQNCGTNAMHIGQFDNTYRFNGYIKDFKIVRGIMSSADIEKDFEKYGEGGGGSGGIYHNASLGLISLSLDGVSWKTIADKNLGATSRDVTNTNSYGDYYSRGALSNRNGTSAANYVVVMDGEYRSNGNQSICPNGFHIPTRADWTNLITVLSGLLGIPTLNYNQAMQYLLLPRAGQMLDSGTTVVYAEGNGGGYYWTADKDEEATSFLLRSINNNLYATGGSVSDKRGFTVRVFKDTPVVPDSSWTKLF